MKEGKLEIRFSEVQQLIWHGEEAKAVIRRWEKGPMTPGVEGPRADTVEVVQRAIVLRSRVLTPGKTHYTTIRAAPVQGQLHMQTGKLLDLKDILHRVNIRKP